jgi:carbamoylphosphate synthase large subunit
VPKRTDINNILIIGSGPIVIGQGCEFDYSGTQACKALREEGYGVVLINSNPATIMTDPGLADRTYIEPITPEFIEKIFIREREDGRPIDALLPTLGGQTGLNCAMEVAERGLLEQHGVTMIGATPTAIHKAEDRTAFKQTMIAVGLDVPKSGVAHSWDEARRILTEIQLPCCIRPAYTLGGEGGGFARTQEEFETIAKRGLKASRVTEILIEEDLYGWKEYELEVMRDRADNVVIICSIENLDPMGVHTGDSITVAPAQTLTDKEFQKMRDSAIAIIRAIGVDTGGCNIQFAVDPQTGRQVVIEMNPRVSRSSALASKATGYPIARIAAKLAVGYTLDELTNDITGTTPASFEPTIDYVVVKMPRWNFEKFPDADETLTTQMKSVGEAMAIGRTFKEAFQKCIRSMEIQRYGFGLDRNDAWLKRRRPSVPDSNAPRAAGEMPSRLFESPRDADFGERSMRRPDSKSPVSINTLDDAEPIGGVTATEAPPDTAEEHARHWPIPDKILRDKLARPCQGRPYYIRYAFKMGWSVERVHELTRIDPWFLEYMLALVEDETEVESAIGSEDSESLGRVKQLGYSNIQLCGVTRRDSETVSRALKERGVSPVYKLVDTCAAEFEARTPYFYSSHESRISIVGDNNGKWKSDDEIRVTDKPKIVILGGGPNRIGQGIEFDYCCCHASFAARAAGFESVMINSNPETVSTDYDTSDMLFFEPLTHEDVLNVIERLNGSPLDYNDRKRIEVTKNPNRDHLPFTRSVNGEGADAAATEPRSHEATKGRDGGPKGRRDEERDRNPQSSIPNRQSAPDLGSSTFDLRPSTPDLEPSTFDFRPSTFDLRPSTFDFRPSTFDSLIQGVIVQFGGQTPLNLAQGLKDAGVPIIGTQPEMIHLAEDREQFQKILRELSLRQPPSGIARHATEARQIARHIGYPVIVRPSYVLGGRGMKICNNEQDLDEFLTHAFVATDRTASEQDNPVLIDKFLADAIEVDVDAIADFGRDTSCATNRATTMAATASPGTPPPMCMVAGIMEHIEECGIHSGDSTCVLPPFSLGRVVIEEIFRSTKRLAKRLGVCGAINVQYAVLNRTVYVLEVNPRASRTLPFVAKATGVPWAQVATRVMLGEALADVLKEYGITETPMPKHTSIKAPVFPFDRFPGVDVILGPEMRSTGEVMAIAPTFGRAFAKAQIATRIPLPTSGNALVSVNDPDKPRVVSIARDLHELGFKIFSTIGTKKVLEEAGIPATLVSKHSDTHDAPFLMDLIENGTLNLLINTPIRTGPASAEGRWRSAAFARRIPIITTLAGARAAVEGIRALSKSDDGQDPLPLTVQSLQAYFA